jgi:hypothetical protein
MPFLVIEALLLPPEPDESRYTARIADTTPPASRVQLRTWFGQSFGFVDGSRELIVRRLELRWAANVRPVPRTLHSGQFPSRPWLSRASVASLATSPPLRCSDSMISRSILSLGGGAALVL